ncbi:MAG TPA: hypothetical protein VN282_02230 [Pyrinomonadaceae bacterium]|nr:hypothetical protein [Pyrinomonadaceae bacterium]
MGGKTKQAGAKTPPDDKSASQTRPGGTKSAEEIEASRLDLERERLELDKTIATSRLEFERQKSDRENKFWNRNSGVLITGLISLAALMVTATQIWTAKLQKDREIEMSDRQKDRELSLMDEKNKREWNLSAAKFVAENMKVILGDNAQEKELLAKMLANIYPPEVAAPLLAKLENASPPPEENTWRQEREKIVRPSAPAPSQGSNPTLKPLPRPTAEGTRADSLDKRYRSEKQAGGCVSKVNTNKLGDGIMYICYQVGEDASYCSYDCYPLGAEGDR